MEERSTIRTIGMDLGDTEHVIHCLDDTGQTVLSRRLINTRGRLARFFEQFAAPGSVLVAMESGTHSPWISHLLSELGFEVLVGNARKLRAIWQNDRKDDYRDAEMLARIARFDRQLLSPIRHRSMSAHADVSLLRARDALVRSRALLINCARGLVKSEGGRLPRCSAEAFAAKAPDHVPTALAPAINPLVSQIAALTSQIRQYDRCIDQLCEQRYPETASVQQVSGVGSLTGLAFILTLENPHRFAKNRSVGPFVGLAPKRHQSGATDKQLSISKAGDGYLRRLLTQSAHYILGPFGPDCDLRRFGQRLAARGGKAAKGRAVAAVARKLAVLMLRLWKTGELYEPFHKQNAHRKTALTPGA